MNQRIRRATSAALLLACLFIAQNSFAGDLDPIRRPGPIDRIVKILKRIFTPTILTDYPTPPKP